MIAAVLMLLVLLVLLVAYANVANLLLALAVKRRQETVIKAAVGATRRRLIFEFLSESATLCVLAALVGFPTAVIALLRISDFSAMLPLIGNLNVTGNVRPDAAVVLIAAAAVLIASLATGLAPALYASSPSLAAVLSGEMAIGGRRKGIIRNSLVVVQVSICTFVLVGLGTCLRSVQNLRHVDPGFSARNVLGAMVIDGGHEKRSETNQKQLYKSLAAAASQISGVESVSLVNGLPFVGGFNTSPAELPDQGETIDVPGAVVDENYFATLGVPIFSGRAFDSTDRENGPESVIVNRKLAEMLWPNQNALGKTVRIGRPLSQVRIVGVAGNGKYNDLDEPTRPFVYYAFSQHFERQIQVVIRTKGDPHLWSEPLSRAAQHRHGRSAPAVHDGRLLYLEMLVPMLTLYGVGGLGALALLLAMIGLFGAISYSVGERKRELGIHSALGALPFDLLKLVLRNACATADSGIIIGALLGSPPLCFSALSSSAFKPSSGWRSCRPWPPCPRSRCWWPGLPLGLGCTAILWKP